MTTFDSLMIKLERKGFDVVACKNDNGEIRSLQVFEKMNSRYPLFISENIHGDFYILSEESAGYNIVDNDNVIKKMRVAFK